MKLKYDESLEPEAKLKARASLNKHLEQIKSNLEQPTKDATAGNGGKFSYKYATLTAVLSAIDKASKDIGLTYSQEPVNDVANHLVGARTYLLDESGAIAEYEPFMMPAGRTSQDYGSALTYARRYSISAVFGIASEEDDDAQQATYNQQRRSTTGYQRTDAYRRTNQVPKTEKQVTGSVKKKPSVTTPDAHSKATQNEIRLARETITVNGKKIPLTNVAKGVAEKNAEAKKISDQLEGDLARDFAEIVKLELWKKLAMTTKK